MRVLVLSRGEEPCHIVEVGYSVNQGMLTKVIHLFEKEGFDVDLMPVEGASADVAGFKAAVEKIVDDWRRDFDKEFTTVEKNAFWARGDLP